MAFVRCKRRGKREYFYLVETYRENGNVHQRTLKYLGTKRPRGRQKGLRGKEGERSGNATNVCR